MTDPEEAARLDAIAARSLYSQSVYDLTVRHCFEVFTRWLRPGSILELGPAEGTMTAMLAGLGRPLTLVEGSASFAQALGSRFPEAEVVCSVFEAYAPRQRFDNVVLGHVLEHVEDPVGLLRRVAGWTAPGGVILTAVPNSGSLHRQAGVLMGLLPREDALNELDLHHGHRRVYDPGSLSRDIEAAGLTLRAAGGYLLKLNSQGQLARIATPEMIAAHCALGERYPEIAAEIYAVATPEPSTVSPP